MDDKLHAARFIEEALGDNLPLRRHRPQNRGRISDVLRDLLRAGIRHAGLAHQPGLRARAIRAARGDFAPQFRYRLRQLKRASGALATVPQHPYAQWVTTYDAPEFHAAVATARELVDAAAVAATDADRAAMLDAFTVATRYELMFWDTALHRQEWPES